MVDDGLIETGQGYGKNEVDKFVKVNDTIAIRTVLANEAGDVTVQNPVPTDGDSIYAKDIDTDLHTDSGTFTGADLLTLFNDYDSEFSDSSATDPKYFIVRFKRPITASSIGIGAGSGDFSNVKILLKDLAGTTRVTIDDSADDTKHTSNLYPFPPNAFIEMRVEFHTADTVTLNGMLITKDVNVVARLQATKPDGTITNIDATAGGNLKGSLEEFDPTFLDNPLPITKGFNIPIYDYAALTYVAAGNGAGEIETVIFKTGGAGGTTVATLTLTYNSSDEIATVTQT